ncbi:hypothetical protein Mgra_00000407 [Meloidogyne graminicola]|uniref:Uncharacterized protein n=1 Tax=Meloidogyne graminicola TaxID=189291 RepID=A0A8T0A1K3_9BILA|nr:hypothetical protein Mgra_00000407 [Meloidogyne graminicola]
MKHTTFIYIFPSIKHSLRNSFNFLLPIKIVIFWNLSSQFSKSFNKLKFNSLSNDINIILKYPSLLERNIFFQPGDAHLIN